MLLLGLEKIVSQHNIVLEKPENKQELIKQVSVACGKEMNIKFIDTKPQVQEASEEQEISNFANGFDIPFDVVE